MFGAKHRTRPDYPLSKGHYTFGRKRTRTNVNIDASQLKGLSYYIYGTRIM